MKPQQMIGLSSLLPFSSHFFDVIQVHPAIWFGSDNVIVLRFRGQTLNNTVAGHDGPSLHRKDSLLPSTDPNDSPIPLLFYDIDDHVPFCCSDVERTILLRTITHARDPFLQTCRLVSPIPIAIIFLSFCR